MSIQPLAYTGAGGVSGALLTALVSWLQRPVLLEAPLASRDIYAGQAFAAPEQCPDCDCSTNLRKATAFLASEASPVSLALLLIIALILLKVVRDGLSGLSITVTFGGNPGPLRVRSSKEARLSGYH